MPDSVPAILKGYLEYCLDSTPPNAFCQAQRAYKRLVISLALVTIGIESDDLEDYLDIFMINLKQFKDQNSAVEAARSFYARLRTQGLQWETLVGLELDPASGMSTADPTGECDFI